ncbi:MAG: glycosyltransferase family 9 protein, partial [Candidatus Hydrothermales bacterium]
MKILISPLFGIGDTLMMTPALKLLKENIKEVELDVFTIFSSTRDVLLYNPFIDNLIYYPLLENRLKGLLYIFKTIRFRNYDHVINFYPTNRKEYNIFSFLTGSKSRIGHTYQHMNFIELNFLKNKKIMEEKGTHNVLENVRLLREFFKIEIKSVPPLSIYLRDEELKLAKNFLKEKGINDKFLIGVHAGSSVFKGHTGKRWPERNFIELFKKIKKKIESSFFIIFGSKDDADVNEFLQRNLEEKILIVNKKIREVAALIKQCKMFISNDSGLMHLAAACGVPVLALFGPTSPYKLFPFGVKHRVCFLNLDCSPCFFYSPKPLRCVKNINFKCMKNMDVDFVYEKFIELYKEI